MRRQAQQLMRMRLNGETDTRLYGFLRERFEAGQRVRRRHGLPEITECR